MNNLVFCVRYRFPRFSQEDRIHKKPFENNQFFSPASSLFFFVGSETFVKPYEEYVTFNGNNAVN